MAERINVRKAIRAIKRMESDLGRTIATDAKNHFKGSFRKQGFTDRSLEKWAKRKRQTARDRRRVSRLKARGKTPRFPGGRAILVEFGAMRRSVRIHRANFKLVRVGSIGIPYSGFHNRGERGFKPIRRFVGKSHVLNRKIRRRITTATKRVLNTF